MSKTYSEIKASIENAKQLNPYLSEVQMKMMARLFAAPGNPTKDEVIPGLDLGRAGDTSPEDYQLIIGVTNISQNGHDRMKSSDAVIQMPMAPGDTDVDVFGFQTTNQAFLRQALKQVDDALKQQKRVLVCCQQGKDRSALFVLCYLVAKYNVSPEQAYDYVQQQRPIVSTQDIPKYWNFLIDTFDVKKAREYLASTSQQTIDKEVVSQPITLAVQERVKPVSPFTTEEKTSTSLGKKIDQIIQNIEKGNQGRWTSGVGSLKLIQLKKIKQRVEMGQEKVNDLLNDTYKVVCHKRHSLHFWKTPESQIDFEKWLQENALTEVLRKTENTL